MVKLKDLFAVSVLLVAELILTILGLAEVLSGHGLIWAAVAYQLILFVFGLSLCVGKKELIYSPFFFFFFMVVFFSVAGEVIFVIREYLGIGWGGVPDDVLVFYRRFCLVSYALLQFVAMFGIGRGVLFFTDQTTRNDFSKLLVLLLLGYFGVFISTNGFSQISILSDNPDAVRYENREISNVAIGSVFLIASAFSSVILTTMRKAGRLSRVSFFCLFLLFYLPLLLSASRLLMLLPFLYLALMRFQYIERLNILNLLKTAVLGLCVLLMAFIFGAYRSTGMIENIDAVYMFLAYDLFPEFSGTVLTHELAGGASFITPLSTVFSGIFPGSLFRLFDLNKFDYYQQAGQLVGELLNSRYTIRLSLMGELYLADTWRLIVFSIFLMFFLSFLHFKIYIFPTSFRHVYVVSGLLASLSVPYGAVFLVITIQCLIFTLLLFGVVSAFSRGMVAISRTTRRHCENSSCA